MVFWKKTAVLFFIGLGLATPGFGHELSGQRSATAQASAALRRWLAQPEFRADRPLLAQLRAYVLGAEALAENANQRASDIIFFYTAHAAVARNSIAELSEIAVRFAGNASLTQWQRAMSDVEKARFFRALGRLSATQKAIARSAIALRFRSILVEAEPLDIWNALALQDRWLAALEQQLTRNFPGWEINRRENTHLLVREYITTLHAQLEPLNLENSQVNNFLSELLVAIRERTENLNRARIKQLAESAQWPVLRELISAKNPLASTDIEGAGEALATLSNALHLTYVIEDELKREELW